MKWNRFLVSILMGTTGWVCFWCPEDEFWHIQGWVSSGSGLCTVIAHGMTGTREWALLFLQGSPCRDDQAVQEQLLTDLFALSVIFQTSESPYRWTIRLLLSLLK